MEMEMSAATVSKIVKRFWSRVWLA